MAGLKFFLGLLPNTAKYEEVQDKLRKEYQEYRQFENSDELRHFLELEKELKSADFASRKKQIQSQKFNQTEEYRKLHEYKALEKSKEIRNYFKVKDSKQLSAYEDFKNSDLLKRYQELLEKFMKTDAIGKAKASMSPKEYKSSEEYRKEKEFQKLKSNSALKSYFRFKDSATFKMYTETEGSVKLKRYKELKEFIHSASFKEVKDYMSLPSNRKYELSIEYKKEQEYKELKSSHKITWFFKTRKKYPFTEVEKWDLMFSDEFAGAKLDNTRWMTRYLYGDKLLDKNYVLADDKHLFTDGNNIEFYNNKMRILTKPEKATGLVWDPLKGFYERDFGYTSGLVSTGKSFRQKYGLYEAKVKIGNSAVTQAFSLLAEQMIPHVDIFRFEENKLKAGNFWKNGSKETISRSLSKTSGSKYTNDYFIYSLEWAPGKLTWKINGVVFKEQSQGVPDNEMYILFNSSLKQDASESGLPSALEVDWIRVYQLAKKG